MFRNGKRIVTVRMSVSKSNAGGVSKRPRPWRGNFVMGGRLGRTNKPRGVESQLDKKNKDFETIFAPTKGFK
ncbi:MAG: hypothetical protein C5B49_03875 [Bdellovibrio sp.]|nr:MAG: hypothetical protein C5B49_03875 [Bdellovibrio sp.]